MEQFKNLLLGIVAAGFMLGLAAMLIGAGFVVVFISGCSWLLKP